MRDSYPPQQQRKQATTLPPKIFDIKYYSEYTDPNDSWYQLVENILFSFTFDQKDQEGPESKSPAYEFLIEIENLNTGVVKNFIQLFDAPYYRFWQRQAEVYTESPMGSEIDLATESVVNSRITVRPINDYGYGITSTFILPFKDLVWTRSKTNQEEGTFSILNSNWGLFSDTPEDRNNRPKIMYIYLDVPEEVIDIDRKRLSTPKWAFDSLTDSTEINNATYRWSVSGTDYRKLSNTGWRDMDSEEQQFIIDLIQTMLPEYRTYMTDYQLAADESMIFKMAVENPRDNRDTIIIYLMKGKPWEL